VKGVKKINPGKRPRGGGGLIPRHPKEENKGLNLQKNRSIGEDKKRTEKDEREKEKGGNLWGKGQGGS